MKIDHITINVSDIDRSTRFYCDGLGFEHVDDQIVGDEGSGPALSPRPYRVHSRHLMVKDGIRVVLNRIDIPAPPLPEYRKQYGITNLAVYSQDIDTQMVVLKSLGGTPIADSRAQFSYNSTTADVMVCLDPDGQPVELIAILAD